MKQFIDTTGGLWFQGKLVNKVVAAFTSAQNTYGGQESTLFDIPILNHRNDQAKLPEKYNQSLVEDKNYG